MFFMFDILVYFFGKEQKSLCLKEWEISNASSTVEKGNEILSSFWYVLSMSLWRHNTIQLFSKESLVYDSSAWNSIYQYCIVLKFHYIDVGAL